jgi:hypothetical protein
MSFAVQRHNRGKETLVFEVHPVEGCFGRHEVVFRRSGTAQGGSAHRRGTLPRLRKPS